MNRQKRNTIILVLVIVIIAGVGLIAQHILSQKPAAYVVIVSDEKEVERLDLAQDTELTIESPYGGYNVVEVKDQTVRVKESDCENQICVHQGQIRESYEVIVCLPHGLIVSIEEN